MINKKIRFLKSFALTMAFLALSFLDIELRQKNILMGILLGILILMIIWDFIIRPYGKRERNIFFFYSGLSLLIGIIWVTLFFIQK